MSARQLTVAGWALLVDGLDAEGVEDLEGQLNAPPLASREARRERALLVAKLKGGR